MFRTIALLTAFSVCAPVLALAQSPDRNGDLAVAERLAKLAQLSLAKPDVGDDNFRQAAALLQAACRLNPNEPRFSRLLVEAQLQLNNTVGATEALELYLKVNPRDQVARLQLVDLYAAEMETAERRLVYYTQDLLPMESLPAAFRSAIAVRAAKLYLDRDQISLASDMVDQALRLNPLNPEACELDWEGVKVHGTPAEKVGALLGLLRANPAQPEVMNLLATVLSNAGMHDSAQRWWSQSFEITPRMGRPLSKEVMVEAAASNFILGQTKSAEARVGSLIAFDPSVFDAHLVNVLSARRLGGEATITKANDAALASVAARINSIHKELAGEESPTTRPSGEVTELIPDPAADAALLKEKQREDLTEAYAAAWSDLAFLVLMYTDKPAEADAVVAALRTILPPESVVLARLEGVQLLRNDKVEDGRTKLATVADRDPLSQMALIQLQAKDDKQAAASAAIELLSRHRAGLIGAVLVEGFSQLDIRLDPVEEEAAPIEAELAKFPEGWLKILTKPEDFYSLTASAEKVPFAFGEPILVTVDIKNIGSYDIALTSSGALRPDLWFDCSMKGVQQQQIPGVAFERFGQGLVLRKGELISHTARVDQGQLWQMMQQNPGISFPLFYTVFTNPVPTAMVAGPGPGGYRATLRAIERTPVSLNTPGARDELFKKLNLGDAGEKIRTEEMLAQFSAMIANQPDAPAEAAMMADELRQAIEQGMSDSNARVRAFATYVISQVSQEPRKTDLAMRLANSSDWLQRVLILSAAAGLSEETRAEVLKKLSSDEDAVVKELAESTAAYLERSAAATQPADEGDAPAPSAAPGN